MRTISSLASGKAISFPWTLKLDGRRLTGRMDVLGQSVEERIHLIDLRGLTADDEGMLLVRRADQNEPVELIGPIDPAAARWLAEALSRAVGASANGRAKAGAIVYLGCFPQSWTRHPGSIVFQPAPGTPPMGSCRFVWP